MNKQEFIKLFELEKIYEKCQDKVSFSFGLFDNLTGSNNEIYYVFDDENIKLVCLCSEFNEKIQSLEIHLVLKNGKIELNNNELFINEIFPFLTFDTNLEASLRFIANFFNKILKPKYRLMGTISSY